MIVMMRRCGIFFICVERSVLRFLRVRLLVVMGVIDLVMIGNCMKIVYVWLMDFFVILKILIIFNVIIIFVFVFIYMY